MEAFDYVVALKILAAGSLVYGVVLSFSLDFIAHFCFKIAWAPCP
jgi:hypothetical protein